MTSAWFDWTFLLIVMFPVPLAAAAYAVWATWTWSGSADRKTRLLQRSCSLVSAAACATGTMTSFTAWSIGFNYIETPDGVPARLDSVMNSGWAIGMAGLAAVVAFAAGSFVHRAIRLTTGDAALLSSR